MTFSMQQLECPLGNINRIMSFSSASCFFPHKHEMPHTFWPLPAPSALMSLTLPFALSGLIFALAFPLPGMCFLGSWNVIVVSGPSTPPPSSLP